MLKRSIVFTSAAQLSLKNSQMVVSLKQMPDEVRTIPIEDIGVVIIDHPMVSITVPLLNELSANNVSVVFCEKNGMPNCMLQNLNTSTTQGEILRLQLSASDSLKKRLWKQIVERKIRNQAALLSKLYKNGEALKPLYSNVKHGDADNREGIAARLYFTSLFGKDFVRCRENPGINALLNYGYSILRANVARAIMGTGLFPALSLFHSNRSNAFPLADDLMEPYRPFVDEIVHGLVEEGKMELSKDEKAALIRVQYCDTYVGKTLRPLNIALSMTTASLVKCFSKESMALSLPRLE